MRYELIREIATGGMATVLLARDRQSGGLVVLKRVLPHLAEEPDFVAMFKEEAALAARLDHPNVVRVIGHAMDAGAPVLVLEHLEGVDLAFVLSALTREQRGLPQDVLAHVVGRAASGLAYVHAACGADGAPLHIVHRDVSPPNLFFTFEGAVKLLDFGIAKTRDTLTRTSAGVARGKAGYLAPEQTSGSRVTAASDVFALGVVAWELAAGRRLFERDTPAASAWAAANEPAWPLASFRPDLPFAGLIDRCLAKFHGHRPPATALASLPQATGAACEWLFARLG